MNSNKTIFVGIAAFNEEDIISTIENCLENAAHPERIHFGLALHYCEMERPVIKFPNTKTIDIAYGALWGVCPTRSLALGLYDQEDFYLQLDGHMKFDKDWDSYLIDVYYQAVAAGHEKPLFTGYVPWWSIDDDGSVAFYSPINETMCGTMHYNDEVHRTIPQQTTQYVNWGEKEAEFAIHYGFSAHFVFADAQFIYDVPPDPEIMFYGEEPTTALRAWTRGYTIMIQRKATVWHKNKIPEAGKLHERDRMFYAGYSYDLQMHHHRKNRLGELKAQMILTGSLLGLWGAPDIKSYLAYVKESGFNFNEFYSKTMQFRLNDLANKTNLGYNQKLIEQQKYEELKIKEAQEANYVQSINIRDFH